MGNMLPRLGLSRPATPLPDHAVCSGTTLTWLGESSRRISQDREPTEQGNRYAIGRCNTKARYLETNGVCSQREFPARAATACPEQSAVASGDDELPPEPGDAP